MPTYTYTCNKCQTKQEKWCPPHDRQDQLCDECGEKLTLIPSLAYVNYHPTKGAKK